MARAHVREWVTCSSFRCEKVKADLVTILLGKEGGVGLVAGCPLGLVLGRAAYTLGYSHQVAGRC